MALKVLIPVLLLSVALPKVSAQSTRGSQQHLSFMGRLVTVTEPEKADEDGFFPKGPASICIEGPPRRQCYTAPQEYGNSPEATVVQIRKDMPALLFTAASGGISGWSIHFALLRPGDGQDLDDLFSSDMLVSNQNQHVFWADSSISDALIFVTADYVFGPDEGHYGAHRYMISSYVWGTDDCYRLEDRYMTARKYDFEANDILGAEKQEALARLKRVKAESKRERQATQ